MIVVDASAAVSALLREGAARRLLAREQVHVPHLVDVEVTSALRGLEARREVSPEDAGAALAAWRRLGLTRYAMSSLLARVWALRARVSTYDATYVALAEALDCPLVTADARLARAPRLRCAVTVVPR